MNIGGVFYRGPVLGKAHVIRQMPKRCINILKFGFYFQNGLIISFKMIFLVLKRID